MFYGEITFIIGKNVFFVNLVSSGKCIAASGILLLNIYKTLSTSYSNLAMLKDLYFRS